MIYYDRLLFVFVYDKLLVRDRNLLRADLSRQADAARDSPLSEAVELS